MVAEDGGPTSEGVGECTGGLRVERDRQEVVDDNQVGRFEGGAEMVRVGPLYVFGRRGPGRE